MDGSPPVLVGSSCKGSGDHFDLDLTAEKAGNIPDNLLEDSTNRAEHERQEKISIFKSSDLDLLEPRAVVAVDSQSGWSDESNRYALDMSRFELYSQILGLGDSVPAINLKAFDVNMARYDDICNYYKESGVVKLRGVFPDMGEVASYRSASEKAIKVVEGLSWLENDRETKDLQGTIEALGLTVCTRHCRGRYDLYPADSSLLIPYLNTHPPIVDRLLSDSMGCSGFIVNSSGYIPVLPQAAAGEWHRDIKSMFNWPDAQGSADAADKMDCTRLPDFYCTLFIMLHDSPPERGGAETEFILGSHRLSVSETLSKLESQNQDVGLACNFEYKAGDVILMNGKVLHRGRKNALPDFVRHCIYIVYSASWYSANV